MTSEFNRIITLLRKERGITQKQAASDLGVSQALLSHYEKGIRECGLEFVVKVADYYNVSCDYLLGRSADRSGLTLNIEDLPEDETRADSKYRGSILPTMNKKFLVHSLNVLYDKLSLNPDKGLVTEISAYLMIAVYKMFRLVYTSNSRNVQSMFRVPTKASSGYATAEMLRTEANVEAILAGEDTEASAGVKDTAAFAMTTESLTKEYPMHSRSLLNLIKTCEERILP